MGRRSITSKAGGAAGAYVSGGTDVAVADGGTGASDAATALTNLGAQAAATAYAVGGTDVALADGGTGASTAADARTNLELGTMATATATDYVAKALVTAKGDIVSATASATPAVLAVGATNGMRLVKDSAEATGLRWNTDVLWTWNGANTSQFTNAENDASVDVSLSVSSGPLGEARLVMTKNNATTSGHATFVLNDFTAPASGRYVFEGKIGPIDTNIGMRIAYAHQARARTHAIRRTDTTSAMTLAQNNDSTTETTLAAQTAIRGNSGNYGGYFRIAVEIVQPVAGVSDPAVFMVLNNQESVAADNTSFTGGSPVHSSGWDADWRTGGNLGVALIAYLRASGSGSTVWCSHLRILKHPFDLV